jgi:predicted MFS family arabinose efflux permease
LWFQKRRGIAVAIVASGNYLAGAIWSPLLTHSIEAYGWRTSFWVIGIMSVVLMLPLTLLLRRRATLDEKPSPTAGSSTASGTPTLQALLVLAGLACCVAMSMPQVHIIAYCGDLGYGAAAGAKMLSLMLGFGVISRLLSGYFSDKIGGVGTLIIGSVLQCLALLFYIPFDGLASLYVVSALFGLSQGGIVPSYALIVRDNFPAKEAGFRISLVLTATVFGMALGGWLSGEIFDKTGSYTWAFAHGIGWNLLNLSIAIWLLFRKRSIPAVAIAA